MSANLRRAIRRVFGAPASSLAATLTLALTLGAGGTIFVLVEQTLLTPPPFADPDALVLVGKTPREAPSASLRAVDGATWQRWRTVREPATLAAFDPQNVTVSGLGSPQRLSGTAVTAGFFELLGVTPRVGRTFRNDDDAVVIASYAFWNDVLLADPDPLGRIVIVSGRPHTVIGVFPATFAFGLNPTDVWRPLRDDGNARVRVIGRLAPGVDPGALRERLDVVDHGDPALVTTVVPVRDALEGTARSTLPLLAAGAVLAAMLAAINIAVLMLLRLADRRAELAVCVALGASRVRLLQPLALEVWLLAAAGAIGGLLIVLWATPLSGRLVAGALNVPTLDLVMSRTTIVTLLAVAFGVWAVSVGIAATSTVAGSHRVQLVYRGQTPPAGPMAVRRALVIAQLAVAFVLLAAVLVVGRSLYRLTAIDPGFAVRDIVTARVSLPPAPYATATDVTRFYATLDARLAERFGRPRAALIDELPLTGDNGRVRIGRIGTMQHEAVVRTAGPAYFDVLGIRILHGRAFTDADHRDGTARVVISGSLAAALDDGAPLVGASVRIGATVAQVIGIVADVKHRALEESPLPTVYLNALERPSRSAHVVVHGEPGRDSLAEVRAEVARLDPDLPVYAPRLISEYVDASPGVPTRRIVSGVFTAFAVLALLLASIGIFGVSAHDVSCRRLELALRVALGASPVTLQFAVLRQTMLLVVPGLAGGALLWRVLSRGLDAVVFGVTTTDIVALSLAVTVLTVLALAAAALPARRAARTNPIAALRGD
jgi:predicted permease